MKNLIKIFSIFFVFTLFYSCDNNSSDLGFEPSPESGWIQFIGEGGSIPNSIFTRIVDQEVIGIPVNIQVPTTTSDLTINYNLVSISGLDPNTLLSNNGFIIVPIGQTSYAGPDNNTGIDYSFLASIDFDFSEIDEALLTEQMIFDVVLTGTSSGSITAGLNGENFPITQRIIVCPKMLDFSGTYTVSEQFTGGPNAPLGLSDFFGESYQVEITAQPGDTTGTKFVIDNSVGFDTYFFNSTVITLDNDEVVFDAGNPVVALFTTFNYDNSSYNTCDFSIICSGPLGGFGPYEFVLTKQ